MSERETPFDDEERVLLEGVAARIAHARFAVPAMMFLETVAPMNVVTASMLTIASPIWRIAIPSSRIDDVARLLERRDAIPSFLSMIDEAESRRVEQARAAKRARRDRKRTSTSESRS